MYRTALFRKALFFGSTYRCSIVVTIALGTTLGCDPQEADLSGDPGNDDIPIVAYCDPVADWPELSIANEDETLVLVNQARSRGASCGSEGSFVPAPPLQMDGALRCAARVHSKDMSDRGFFDHTTPDGQTPWQRMEQAGYLFRAAGENIAQGYSSPENVVTGWMNSDGHCSNIMNPDFTEVGAGYYQGDYWTLVFAVPR